MSMIPASASLLGALAGASLKGTVILGAAGVATALARRASAATRHLIWTSAIVAMIALPALSAVLPAWRAAVRVPMLTLPAPDGRAVPISTAGPVSYSAPADRFVRESEADLASNVAATASIAATAVAATPVDDLLPTAKPTFNIIEIITLIWLVGVLIVSTLLIIGRVRLRWVARSARRADEETWGSLADRLPEELCPGRPVRLLESDHSAMPMTWGVFRPVLLLPGGARAWPAWQRRNVLLHEMAHVRRLDCLTQLVAQLACAIHWFNPLVWVAASRLRVEREHACDDQVLLAGSKASDYASHLLDVARSLRPATGTGLASVAMARPSQLSGRLLAVLDEHRSRARVSRRAALRLGLATLLMVLPLAAFTPFAAVAPPVTRVSARSVADTDTVRVASRTRTAESRAIGASQAQGVATASTTASTGGLSTVATSETAAAAGAAATAASTRATAVAGTGGQIESDMSAVGAPPRAGVAVRGEQCVSEGASRGSSSSNMSDWSSENGRARTWTVKFSSKGCEYSLRAVGDVTFNRDGTDVVKIASGGYFELEERDGSSVRRIDIRPASDGSLERKYYVDGKPQEYGADARAWLAATLVAVERRTAFAADTRVPMLYESGGVDAVLKEITLIESDYAKRRYFTALLKSAQLNAGEVQRAVRQASTEMHSDYEMAELLIALAKLPHFESGSHVAYADGVVRIKSDYEKRRAMTALLGRDKLGKDVINTLLTATESMHSDYELAEFLISVSNRYPADADTRKFYLDAIGRIRSDYERRRVLTAVASNGEIDGATSAAALASAGDMKSDYEKTEMLVTVAKRGTIDAQGRSSYITAARTINSAYEKRRALMALLGQRPLSKEIVTSVLEIAPTLKSDYETSELLISVAHAIPIDDALRPAYEKAAESIKGEYEYGRAMGAIRRR
ncbi:MAG: M56 family metallopeptidase [Gemmatimonadaceae bacterium]